MNNYYFAVRNWQCGLLVDSSFRAAATGYLSPRLLGFYLLATFRSLLFGPLCRIFLFGLKLFYVFSFMYYFVIATVKNYYSCFVCISDVFSLYASSRALYFVICPFRLRIMDVLHHEPKKKKKNSLTNSRITNNTDIFDKLFHEEN